MSKTTKELSVEELDKELLLINSSTSKIIRPRNYDYLYGESGSNYKLTEINLSDDRVAEVSASNGDKGYIQYGTLGTSEHKQFIFEMNSSGRIKVYNRTNNEYYPKPEVMFIIKRL